MEERKKRTGLIGGGIIARSGKSNHVAVKVWDEEAEKFVLTRF